MASNADHINGWNEWSKYVLKELERLNECYEKLDEKVSQVRIDIVRFEDIAKKKPLIPQELINQLRIDTAKLNTRTSILWAAIAGSIPLAVTIILWVLSK